MPNRWTTRRSTRAFSYAEPSTSKPRIPTMTKSTKSLTKFYRASNCSRWPACGAACRFAGDEAGDGNGGVYVEDLRLTSGSNIASFTMPASNAGADVTVIAAAYIETASAPLQESCLSFMSLGPG
jgi:hypothetical protein